MDVILAVTNHNDGPVEYDLTKPTMIPKRMIDVQKVRALTGWEPVTDLASGIKKTVEWYRDYYSMSTPEEAEK